MAIDFDRRPRDVRIGGADPLASLGPRPKIPSTTPIDTFDLSRFRMNDQHYQSILQAGDQLYYNCGNHPQICSTEVRQFIASHQELAHHFIDPRTLQIVGGRTLAQIEKTQQYIERQTERLATESLSETARARIERQIENAERRLGTFASTADSIQRNKMRQLMGQLHENDGSEADRSQEQYIRTASLGNRTGLAMFMGGEAYAQYIDVARESSRQIQLAQEAQKAWDKNQNIMLSQRLDESRPAHQRSPHTNRRLAERAIAGIEQGPSGELRYAAIRPTSVYHMAPAEFQYHRERVEKNGPAEVAGDQLKSFLFAYAAVASPAEKQRLPASESSLSGPGPYVEAYHKGVLLLAEKFKLDDDPAAGARKLRDLQQLVQDAPGAYGMSPQEMAGVFDFSARHLPGKNFKERAAEYASLIGLNFPPSREVAPTGVENPVAPVAPAAPVASAAAAAQVGPEASVGPQPGPRFRPRRPPVSAPTEPEVTVTPSKPERGASPSLALASAGLEIQPLADSPYRDMFRQAKASGYDIRLTGLGAGSEGNFTVYRNNQPVGNFLMDVKDREKRLATILSGLLGYDLNI